MACFWILLQYDFKQYFISLILAKVIYSFWLYCIMIESFAWLDFECFWDFIVRNSLFHWFLLYLCICSHCIALRQIFAWSVFGYFWNLILSNSLFHWFLLDLFICSHFIALRQSFASPVLEYFWNMILSNSLFHWFLLKLYIYSNCIALRPKALLSLFLNTSEIWLKATVCFVDSC